MAAKDKGLIPTGLFIGSLNVMIDDQEKDLLRFAAGYQILCSWRFSPSPLLLAHLQVTRVGSKQNAAACRSI